MRNTLSNIEATPSLPDELLFIEQNAAVFFEILDTLKKAIIDAGLKANPYAPPKVNLNMCGYTASALTELFRKRGLKSRVVYGHYWCGQQRSYHYWTEVLINGNRYAVDATYGQFRDGYLNKFLIFEVTDLWREYRLSEYKEAMEPPLGGIDLRTLVALAKNGGVLPMRQHIQDSTQKDIFEKLVLALVQHVII